MFYKNIRIKSYVFFSFRTYIAFSFINTTNYTFSDGYSLLYNNLFDVHSPMKCHMHTHTHIIILFFKYISNTTPHYIAPTFLWRGWG